MSLRLVLIGVAIGIVVSIWIASNGEPSQRFTATVGFAIRALTIAVIASEIVKRVRYRREERRREAGGKQL